VSYTAVGGQGWGSAEVRHTVVPLSTAPPPVASGTCDQPGSENMK
jgi:hypothetical protein